MGVGILKKGWVYYRNKVGIFNKWGGYSQETGLVFSTTNWAFSRNRVGVLKNRVGIIGK
jgi:hypothetical protein